MNKGISMPKSISISPKSLILNVIYLLISAEKYMFKINN